MPSVNLRIASESLQFAIGKATAAIHERLAIQIIQDWYARTEGKRIHVRYNENNGLEQKRECDLIDTFGCKWEVKFDRLAGATGNVFLEHQALLRSGADFLLIFASGLTFVLPKGEALELLSQFRVAQGGDWGMATGTLVPISELMQYAT